QHLGKGWPGVRPLLRHLLLHLRLRPAGRRHIDRHPARRRVHGSRPAAVRAGLPRLPHGAPRRHRLAGSHVALDRRRHRRHRRTGGRPRSRGRPPAGAGTLPPRADQAVELTPRILPVITYLTSTVGKALDVWTPVIEAIATAIVTLGSSALSSQAGVAAFAVARVALRAALSGQAIASALAGM